LHAIRLVRRADLNAIAARALRVAASDRYASANAMAEDIKCNLDDEPVLAAQGARLYTLGKFLKRQRIPLVVGAAGAVAATALGITALMQYKQAKATPRPPRP
jgi:eukaryotic-like serine/threonine-protein kinase